MLGLVSEKKKPLTPGMGIEDYWWTMSERTTIEEFVMEERTQLARDGIDRENPECSALKKVCTR